MSARSTTLAQAFSKRLLKEMYDRSVLDAIVNRDYEGEVNAIGSKINILNFDRITERDFTGADMASADSLTENNAILTLEKQKAFYWQELTLDNWKSYIKDPHSTPVAQKADERNKNMDIYALGFYGDVQAGQRDGTDYTSGTVTVTATTGEVVGDGTTFTSSMVGRGFKATGHTKWYRVKSYSSATSIYIEDDLDDVASAYTGGAIGAGATYTIEAVTPVAITTTNLIQRVASLKLKLDSAEKNALNAVPDMDRFLIVPPEFDDIVVRASGVALHVPEVFTNLVQKGFIGMLLGFKVFRSNRLTGDNTNGYRVLAGHPNWLTFAEKLLQADIEEEIKGNFGTAYKDLFVYGGKVADARRSFASEGYWTFTI